jgi:hypothetical protein
LLQLASRYRNPLVEKSLKLVRSHPRMRLTGPSVRQSRGAIEQIARSR